MALDINFDPSQPIPNNPFYYPQSETIQSGTGPLVIGQGLEVDYRTGTLNSTGGGGNVGSVAVVPPLVNIGTPGNIIIAVQVATTGSPGSVQIGANIDVNSSGVISVKSATLVASTRLNT